MVSWMSRADGPLDGGAGTSLGRPLMSVPDFCTISVVVLCEPPARRSPDDDDGPEPTVGGRHASHKTKE